MWSAGLLNISFVFSERVYYWLYHSHGQLRLYFVFKPGCSAFYIEWNNINSILGFYCAVLFLISRLRSGKVADCIRLMVICNNQTIIISGSVDYYYRKHLILHNINGKYLTLQKYLGYIFMKCLKYKGNNVEVKGRKLKTLCLTLLQCVWIRGDFLPYECKYCVYMCQLFSLYDADVCYHITGFV